MRTKSVAWVLAGLGAAAALALGVLVMISIDVVGVAVMAANGDPELLILLTKWHNEARLASAVVLMVALVLSSAPLWLVPPVDPEENTAPRRTQVQP